MRHTFTIARPRSRAPANREGQDQLDFFTFFDWKRQRAAFGGRVLMYSFRFRDEKNANQHSGAQLLRKFDVSLPEVDGAQSSLTLSCPGYASLPFAAPRSFFFFFFFRFAFRAQGSSYLVCFISDQSAT